MTHNKHSKRTMFKKVRETFSAPEIELADIIMKRMGSWDTRKAFANDIKCLYLYAARDILNYMNVSYQLIERF